MCFTNIVLDPILIFGWGPVPALGIAGAAVANVSSRLLAFLGVVSYLHYRLHVLTAISLRVSRLRATWGKILHIGLPALAAQLVAPLSMSILTKIVSLSGTLAVAAYGVGSRVELLSNVYVWAVAGALPPFVGQNAGAGRLDRVRIAVNLSTKFCIAGGIVMLVIAMVAADAIAALFTDNAEIATLAAYYMRVVAPSLALAGLVLTASQVMNALARPLPAAVVNLLRTVVIMVPFALIGRRLGEIQGAFIGISVAGATCGIIAWVVMSVVVNQEAQHRTIKESAPTPTAAQVETPSGDVLTS